MRQLSNLMWSPGTLFHLTCLPLSLSLSLLLTLCPLPVVLSQHFTCSWWPGVLLSHANHNVSSSCLCLCECKLLLLLSLLTVVTGNEHRELRYCLVTAARIFIVFFFFACLSLSLLRSSDCWLLATTAHNGQYKIIGEARCCQWKKERKKGKRGKNKRCLRCNIGWDSGALVAPMLAHRWQCEHLCLSSAVAVATATSAAGLIRHSSSLSCYSLVSPLLYQLTVNTKVPSSCLTLTSTM